MITSPDVLNGATTEPVKAQAPPGPFTPPAIDDAFGILVEAGLTMAQLRAVEAILDRALGEIISHAAKYHQADLGVLLKWLLHLRVERSEPVSSLMTQHDNKEMIEMQQLNGHATTETDDDAIRDEREIEARITMKIVAQEDLKEGRLSEADAEVVFRWLREGSARMLAKQREAVSV